MNKAISIAIVATSLVLLCTESAVACPSFLQCANFTALDKRADCNYVVGQHVSRNETQQVLCILWEQSYTSSGTYQPSSPRTNATVSLPYHAIDNGNFILASKILALTLVNYALVAFSKYSTVVRWLTAA